MEQEDFRKELERLLNYHSMEKKSNTPDFILASYLVGCLAAFDAAVKDRDLWYGRLQKPTYLER